jgi:hypothetical protein
VGLNVFGQTTGPSFTSYVGSAVLGFGKAAMASGEATNFVTFINPSYAGWHALTCFPESAWQQD